MENETPPFVIRCAFQLGRHTGRFSQSRVACVCDCRTSSGGMLDFQNWRVRIGNVWLPSDRGALPAWRCDAEARGLK
jgi:hypothetical protein